MAHFAKINDSGTVEAVIVISDSEAPDPAPSNSEPLGQRYISEVLGLPGVWRQTSYSGSFRKNFAGLDYVYDEKNDAFYARQPFLSWVLNATSFTWEPPVQYPQDGFLYEWNETNKEWIKVAGGQ